MSAARGVAAKLLGVALMTLGALDSMLAWRGGQAGGDAYLVLLIGGALLLLLGAYLDTLPGSKT